MNYDLKIKELTERVEKLEVAEKKRVAKRKREIAFKIIKFVVIIALLGLAYYYINTKIIIPYKEKIDFINDVFKKIQDYNPFF